MPEAPDPCENSVAAPLRVHDGSGSRVHPLAAGLWTRIATGPDSDVVPSCREWIRITVPLYVSDPAALSRMREDYGAGTPAAMRHQNRAMDIAYSEFKEFDIRSESHCGEPQDLRETSSPLVRHQHLEERIDCVPEIRADRIDLEHGGNTPQQRDEDRERVLPHPVVHVEPLV
jgi:hypothetical protein